MHSTSQNTDPNAAPHPARPQLKALTTLRFFAAMYVVLFHMRVTGELPGGPWWYQSFASIGYVGVNFFFVLSGFILVYTYTDPVLDAPRFWQARFARIYPAYVLSLLVAAPFFFQAVGVDPFFAWSAQHLWLACILTLMLLQAWVPQGALTWNPVCWSLSVEVFFYLSFPALLARFRRLTPGGLLRWLVGSALVSLGISIAYVGLHPDGIDKVSSGETTLLWKNILSFNPVVRLPEFLVGMLAGQLFLVRKLPRAAALPLVLGGLVVLGVLVALVGRIPTPWISAGFLSPAFAAIILGLALRPRWTVLLEAKWLLVLGEASYSLYLLHSTVMPRVYEATSSLPHWIRVSLALIAALGAAVLCFFYVEKPGRDLLRRRRRMSGVALGREA